MNHIIKFKCGHTKELSEENIPPSWLSVDQVNLVCFECHETFQVMKEHKIRKYLSSEKAIIKQMGKKIALVYVDLQLEIEGILDGEGQSKNYDNYKKMYDRVHEFYRKNKK